MFFTLKTGPSGHSLRATQSLLSTLFWRYTMSKVCDCNWTIAQSKWHRPPRSTGFIPQAPVHLSDSENPFWKNNVETFLFFLFSSFHPVPPLQYFFDWTYTSSIICILTLNCYVMFSPQCWRMAPSALLCLLLCSACHLHLRIKLFFQLQMARENKKKKNFHPQEHFCVSWQPSIRELTYFELHPFIFIRPPRHPM